MKKDINTTKSSAAKEKEAAKELAPVNFEEKTVKELIVMLNSQSFNRTLKGSEVLAINKIISREENLEEAGLYYAIIDKIEETKLSLQSLRLFIKSSLMEAAICRLQLVQIVTGTVSGAIMNESQKLINTYSEIPEDAKAKLEEDKKKYFTMLDATLIITDLQKAVEKHGEERTPKKEQIEKLLKEYKACKREAEKCYIYSKAAVTNFEEFVKQHGAEDFVSPNLKNIVEGIKTFKEPFSELPFFIIELSDFKDLPFVKENNLLKFAEDVKKLKPFPKWEELTPTEELLKQTEIN